MRWYRRNREAVLAALRDGQRPEMATMMASGLLDELIALHREPGVLAELDDIEPVRERDGVADELLYRTLGVVPFVSEASLSGGTELLFKEPAILLELGWAPVHLR